MSAAPTVTDSGPDTAVDRPVSPARAPLRPSARRPARASARSSARSSARGSSEPEDVRARREPWSARAVVRLFEFVGVGLIGLGAAWYGCSGTTSLHQQILWTVLGIAGALVAAFGQGMFVLDGFRALRERRLAAMSDVATLVGRYEPETPVAGSDDDQMRIATEAMTHYHRPGCPLVSGKSDLVTASARAHLAAGRTACGVCVA